MRRHVLRKGTLQRAPTLRHALLKKLTGLTRCTQQDLSRPNYVQATSPGKRGYQLDAQCTSPLSAEKGAGGESQGVTVMKKLLCILALVLIAAYSFADPFTPTVLKLTVPSELSYSFDSSILTIPVTVSGTSAALWLVINTKG